MNLMKVLVGFISLMFLTLSVDKFLYFMEPPCTLMDTIGPTIWKLLGVATLIGGILIWLPKYRKSVASFFIVYMLGFTIYHLVSGTSDVGGAVFMAVLLSIVVWNPSFMQGKKKVT